MLCGMQPPDCRRDTVVAEGLLTARANVNFKDKDKPRKRPSGVAASVQRIEQSCEVNGLRSKPDHTGHTRRLNLISLEFDDRPFCIT